MVIQNGKMITYAPCEELRPSQLARHSGTVLYIRLLSAISARLAVLVRNMSSTQDLLALTIDEVRPGRCDEKG